MRNGRSRRQDVSILTETNSITDFSLEIAENEAGYAVSSETMEAWGLDSNQQAEDEKTGKYIQIISERSCKPIRIFELEDGKKVTDVTEDNVNAIASMKEDEVLALISRNKSRDRRMVWFGIIAVIFALVISILVLGQITKGGGLSCSPQFTMFTIPFFGLLHRNLKKSGKGNHRQPNAMIFSDQTKKRILTYVPPKNLPRGSRERKYKNMPVHLLNMSYSGKLLPISPPTKIDAKKSPKALYFALNCEEAEVVYFLSSNIWDKISLLFFYFLIGAEIVVLFLIWAASLG